jgi:hypothetical protein
VFPESLAPAPTRSSRRALASARLSPAAVTGGRLARREESTTRCATKLVTRSARAAGPQDRTASPLGHPAAHPEAPRHPPGLQSGHDHIPLVAEASSGPSHTAARRLATGGRRTRTSARRGCLAMRPPKPPCRSMTPPASRRDEPVRHPPKSRRQRRQEGTLIETEDGRTGFRDDPVRLIARGTGLWSPERSDAASSGLALGVFRLRRSSSDEGTHVPARRGYTPATYRVRARHGGERVSEPAPERG